MNWQSILTLFPGLPTPWYGRTDSFPLPLTTSVSSGSYKIREHDKEEGQVSTGVRILHAFESRLLRSYQRYLKFLERCLKLRSMRPVAAQALCTLMAIHPHFNYFPNIVQLVIPLLLDKTLVCSLSSSPSPPSPPLSRAQEHSARLVVWSE